MDNSAAPVTVEKDALVIGRLQSCDVVLNHRSVSRVHAGINRVESDYFLINLSTSNSLTLNGKLLQSEEADVLADGDIIQIGPFTITVARHGNELELTVFHQFTADIVSSTRKLPPLSQVIGERDNSEVADVLKVFWEKRSREKRRLGNAAQTDRKTSAGKGSDKIGNQPEIYSVRGVSVCLSGRF